MGQMSAKIAMGMEFWGYLVATRVRRNSMGLYDNIFPR
jgi:hypothetical protein